MHPRAALVALILAGAAALLAGRLRFGGDLARLLPDAGAEWQEAARLLERVAVVDIEGGPDDVARFRERLGYPVRELPTEAELVATVDLLRERAGCYVTDYAPIEARLKDVDARIRRLARQLQEPGASGEWAARDPLGIGTEALLGLASLSAGFEGARVDADGLVSGDGEHRLLLVRPGFAPADTERTASFLAALDRAGEGLRVRHLGAHRSTFDNATAIRADATRAAWIGTVAVLLLALFVFRRLAPAVLAVVPGAFGAVIALGAASLARDEVPLAAVGFACVLLGITIDFAIHVLAGRRAPTRAIWMGATTTAAAFLCLGGSVVPGLRDIGVLGAAGVLAAAAFALTVLRPGRSAPRLPPVLWLQGRPVFVAALLALPFVLFGWTRLDFEGDPAALARLSPDTAADEAAIRSVWGDAFRTTTVLVRGDTVEEALQRNDAAARALGDRPNASLHPLLPSRATQRERAARWRAFWTEERIAALGERLAAATEGTPFRHDAFQPCLDWLRRDPEPVGPDDLPAVLWEDRLVETGGGFQVGTPVFDPSLEELPGAMVVNPRALVTRLGRLVGEETLRLGLLAAAAVAVVTFLWFGRLLPVAVVLVPLLASTAWTLGLLGWLGIPITLANAAFVVFLFGLAVDYGIFLVEARAREAATGRAAVAASDAAVLLCAGTTCLGFGALLSADHPVLHSIGATALAGIASSVLLVQVLVPRLWRPRASTASVGALFADQGPMVRGYVRGKAKRDPVVPLLRDLPPARSTLVAGCGYGVMAAARLLRHPGAALRGLDIDERKVEVANGALRRFAHASFEVGDLRAADLGGHDLVTLVDVLHYFPPDEQDAVLRRVADAVEPGGTLLFRDGCTDRAGHRPVARTEWIALATRFTRTGGGLHFRPEQGWRTLLERCGLRVERTEHGPGSNLTLLCRKPNS